MVSVQFGRRGEERKGYEQKREGRKEERCY